MAITLKTVIITMVTPIFLFGNLAFAQSGQHNSHAKSLDQRFSQKTLLKNWTMCVCLAEIAKDEKTKADANETASAYFEFGRQSVEDYDALRDLARKYTRLKYGSSIQFELNTMKCMDLFYSSELDKLSDKLSKRKLR